MSDLDANEATPVDALPFAVTAEGVKPTRGKRPAKGVAPEAAPASAAIIPPAALVAEPVPVTITEPKPALHTEDTTMETMNTAETLNTAETVADTATAKTQAMFGDMNARAKGAMEKGAKLFEDMTAFNKGNIEAIVESSKIAARGVETMAQGSADYARRSFEASNAAVKTLAQTKSPTEFLKLQGDFARQSFDMMMAETSRSTESMLKLAGEIAQPISNRLAVAAEKMKLAA